MISRMAIAASWCALLLVGWSAGAQIQYTFSSAGGYPGPPFTTTVAAGASTKLIVGNYFSPSTPPQAYLQDGKKFITAEPPGTATSYLWSVSNSGLAAGGFCPIACNHYSGQHGYTYNYPSGAITVIDYPGAGTSTANGVNNHGDVLGGFCASAISCPLEGNTNTDHGYLLSHGVFTQIDYPGADSTEPFAINDAGAIVGAYNINHAGPHGFIYQKGVYTSIDYPGAGYTFPTSINNSGIVAGLVSDSTGIHGFLYRKGRFEIVNDPNSPTDTEMHGMNDNNFVIGNYGTAQGKYPTFEGIPKK